MVELPEEPPGERLERARAMAKALSMSILFNVKHYKNIVKILNEKDKLNEEDFENKLRKILTDTGELDAEEINWAFNYLKNYDKDLAAASDKKWVVNPDEQEFHW